MDSYILHVDGTVTSYKPKGEHFTLEELQRAVNGYITIVPLRNNLVMVLNEKGDILNLKVNKIASLIMMKQANRWILVKGKVLITHIDNLE